MEVKKSVKKVWTDYQKYAKKVFFNQYRVQCGICDRNFNNFFKINRDYSFK